MFENLELFLKGKASLQVDKSGKPTSRDIKTAATALLVHMASLDQSLVNHEFETLVKTLVRQFSLSDEEAGSLIEVAKFLNKESAKVEEFIRVVNENFEVSQKQTVMALLWKVMKADGLVSKVEAVFAAKVADILGLTKEQILAAKDLSESGQV